MRDKLYRTMTEFLEVIAQLEDIKTNLILQRKGVELCKEITKEQIESLLNVNLRLIDIVIKGAYKHYSTIDSIVIEMKHSRNK